MPASPSILRLAAAVLALSILSGCRLPYIQRLDDLGESEIPKLTEPIRKK
mgnify:FL=1